MRVPSIVAAIGVITLAAALACGPKTVGPFKGEIPKCVNLWPQGPRADTISVALFDNVDPTHAPEWRNDSERLVFRQLYETLPSGATWPCSRPSRLADAPASNGRSMVFTIRDDARFWDGSPVTSRDVAASVGARDDAFADLDSVIVRDERRVEVVAHSVDWLWLESSTRAIVRPSGALWPMGTGPYRVDVNDDFADGAIVLEPVSGNLPVIRFVDVRGRDPRDLLDGSSRFDILTTRDRAVIDYAQSNDRFGNVPLGQDRGYLLLSPDRARAIERGDTLATLNYLQSSLANDAVQTAYAQAIPGQEWSRAVGRCRATTSAIPWTDTARSRRIVYDAEDPTARDLADRIASLAASDVVLAKALPGIAEAPSVVSVGLESANFARSLATGMDFAYVVGIPYELPDLCRSIDELVSAAPWLGGHDALLSDKALPLVKVTSLAFIARPTDGYGFEISLDRYFRAMIVEPDLTPYP